MDSMKRISPGTYGYTAGSIEYRAEKEVTRISTGLTRGGRNETTWHVYREGGHIADSDTYANARAVVMTDAGKSPEQRLSRLDKPPEREAEPEPDDDGPSPASQGDDPWEYDDGRGETAIGPPTSMERQHSYQ